MAHGVDVSAVLRRAEEKAQKTLVWFREATSSAHYAERLDNYEEIYARQHALRVLWDESQKKGKT